MRTDLATNPKVVAIADALNLDEDTVVGKMHRLWSWADKHAKDGRALGTPAWLDRMMKCKGLANALMRSEIDWLQVEDGALVFPRWEEHNSQSAKTRALAMRRMKDVRAKENGERTSVAPEANTSATESEQRRNASATRGEKRREEKRTAAPAAQDQGSAVGGSALGTRPSAEQQQQQVKQVTEDGEGTQAPRHEGTKDVPPVTSAPGHLTPARQALLAAITGTGASGPKPRAIVMTAAESEVALLAALVREFREQVRRDVAAGKTPPGPGLLLSRLDDFQACCAMANANEEAQATIAHATDLALKYEADDRAKAARIQRTPPSPSAPRHLATSAPSVPGITDHPAFRVLADTTPHPAAPSAAPRLETSTS